MKNSSGLLFGAALVGWLSICGANEAGGQTGSRVVIGEKLGRGLAALPREDGAVYVGWRLLRSDPPNIGFNVYRVADGGALKKVNREPVRNTTDLLDNSPAARDAVAYEIRSVVGDREQGVERARVRHRGGAKPYVSIPLQGDYTFQKVGIADLDGNGTLDFVIKQPNANIDPYEKYWKPSPDTYKLEAYSSEGEFLWRYDLGWAIERGIWYSPYIVFDLDGDGRAEVAAKAGEGDPRDADGRVQKGPEYLTIFEGATGKQIAKIDWPPRSLFAESSSPYNRSSRNQLGIAFLDGRHPYLVVERGTYDRMVVWAYRFDNGKLERIWEWDNKDLPKNFQGQGAHWMHAGDVDNDGRQEIILGSIVLDDNGSVLWTTGLGHPDHCYVGDIDPERPGLEIYYGIERRQPERNGMCLVDAATGKILWGHEGFTRHVHGQGLCSDIDARYPGSECYSADTDEQKKFAWSRLRTCKGKVISEENLGGFSPRVVYWDADLQRELLRGSRISDYGGNEFPVRIEGSVVAVVDLLGDWREEVVTTVPGELRIYATTIPAKDRRVSLIQDPLYRMDVAMAAMGYYQVPMTSYDLTATAR